MRILSWNINGIRASNKTASIKQLLDSLEADIICLQETKITRKYIYIYLRDAMTKLS